MTAVSSVDELKYLQQIRLDDAHDLDVEGHERIGVTCESGHMLELPPLVAAILSHWRTGSSDDEIAEVLLSEHQVAAEPGEIRDVLERVDKQVETIVAGDRMPGLRWLRWQILNENRATRVGEIFGAMLKDQRRVWWLAAASMLLMIVTVNINAYERGGSAAMIAIYVIFILSVFVHEAGHLGASASQGARPGGAGILFLFIWPAFYSDVSSSWRLDRRGRRFVDSAGMLCQSIMGGALALVALIYPASWLLGSILFILFSMMFNLNPFFRMDGYWILADTLGVTSVANVGNKSWFDMFRRRESAISGWRRAVAMFYSAARVLLAIVLIIIFGPRLLGAGAFLKQLSIDLWGFIVGSTDVELVSIGGRLLMVLFAGRILWAVGSMFGKAVVKKIRNSREMKAGPEQLATV